MKQVSRRGGEKRNLRRNNFCAKEDDKKKRRRRNQGQDCGKAVDDSGGGSRLSALISRRRDGAIYPTCYPQSQLVSRMCWFLKDWGKYTQGGCCQRYNSVFSLLISLLLHASSSLLLPLHRLPPPLFFPRQPDLHFFLFFSRFTLQFVSLSLPPSRVFAYRLYIHIGNNHFTTNTSFFTRVLFLM